VIVLETSALIELLTDERGLRERVAARLLSEEAAGDRPYAPALIDAEAAKVLRWLSRKALPEEWELRHNTYPFDAIYAALAEDLGAVLVTTDTKFDPLAHSGMIWCAVETLSG
jgi:predicted nucleic acid-binding protein